MDNIYIISPNFVREITNISSNTQDKFILSAIRECCDMEYQEVVGSCLYEHLKRLIKDNAINNHENYLYRQLLEVSKYYLAYSVVSRIAVIASIKIDNIGANQTSDENVQPLSIKDVFTTENYYHNKADFYRKRVQEFLWDNKKDIPELDSSTCNKIHSNLYSSANCSIFLGGARGKRK